MKNLILSALILGAVTQTAQAGEMSADRANVIKQATIWNRPAWMNPDLSISKTFDIKAAPKVPETQGLLEQEIVECLMTEKYATQDRGTGKSPKFNCDLMKRNPQTGALEVVTNAKGKPVKLKVKYSSLLAGMPGVKADSNPEVQAEVIASRMLNALGFTVDHMFAVKNLICYGCSIDPWNIRELDPVALTYPRRFPRVSIEFKANGEQIKNGDAEGFSFDELLSPNGFSNSAAITRKQLLEREALLLISGFLQHSDNKPDNHGLICDGKMVDGKCDGQVKAYIQDLGFTFGGGTIFFGIPKCFPYCSSKIQLKQWRKVSMWWDESNRPACTVNFGFNAAHKQPVVTEESRLFVSRLLSKFSEGYSGYRRLIDLFNSADIEASGRGKASDWAKAFVEKVEEIGNPALSDNNRERGNPFSMYFRETRADRAEDEPLKCSGSIDNEVQKILRKQN